jgi:amidase
VVDVAMPEFDTLLANTSAINAETKFDLIRYLAGVPGAPVRSVREILDRGLFDRQLEARFRVVDTVSAEDTPWHRTILARQGALRARVDALMDSLGLDALAYPAMRQKPVFLGEVQGGGTCNLSAQSGLPAISLPAGFGADGLPIGLELLGRAFADTQLVAYAYALERARPMRRAPHTTPPLVAGRAPAPRPVVVTLSQPGVMARITVTADPVRHEFRWSAQVSGPRAGAVHALVLRRRGGGQPLTGVISGASATGTVSTRVEVPADAMRVDSRLLGPGMTSARGTLPLGGVLRAAWEAEALSVALLGENGALTERGVPRR